MKRVLLLILIMVGVMLATTPVYSFIRVMNWSVVFSQTPRYSPVVNPNMLEISFDGINFQDASAYISNIVVSIGTASTVHVKHTRRGDVNHWEFQLGEPVQDNMVAFDVNTGVVPPTEKRYYIRGSFAIEDPPNSGELRMSPPTDASDYVQFIGKPARPIRTD